MGNLGKVLANDVKNAINKLNDVNKKKIDSLKSEIKRLSKTANQRLDRIEKYNLQDVPAYQSWANNGAIKFGVKGKNYNELQKELGRLRNFLDNKTSTIRGINRHLKDMASETGIKYKRISELHEKSKTFFQVSSQVQQYLDSIGGMGTALGYRVIWNAINEYVKTSKTDLDNMNIERLTQAVSELLNYEKVEDGYTEQDIWDFFK